MMMTISEKSRMINWAMKAHEEVNHKYDEFPYSYHLNFVANVARKFKHLIPAEDWDNVHVACFCHDLIEDARKTYNDVKNNTNIIVAEMTFALTNEKGKFRWERANDKYYDEMLQVKYAPFVKGSDRGGNQGYSILTGSSMADVYAKEADHFIQKIYLPEYDELFSFLKNIQNEDLSELEPMSLR